MYDILCTRIITNKRMNQINQASTTGEDNDNNPIFVWPIRKYVECPTLGSHAYRQCC